MENSIEPRGKKANWVSPLKCLFFTIKTCKVANKRCLLTRIFCCKGIFNKYMLIRICHGMVEFTYPCGKQVSRLGATFSELGIFVESKRGGHLIVVSFLIRETIFYMSRESGSRRSNNKQTISRGIYIYVNNVSCQMVRISGRLGI